MVVTVGAGQVTWIGQEVTVKVTRRGGRPPKYGPEHWQDVARIYREAYEKTPNRTPTRAVARHFSKVWKKQVSETAAAKWVARCRALGLLPKTTQGKPRAGDVVARPATVKAVAKVGTCRDRQAKRGRGARHS